MSEMSRRETQKLGSIPLHTLDANVDYALTTARTTYGAIGVKGWIYKGKFGEEIEPIRRRRPSRRMSGGPGRPGGSGGRERTPRPAPAGGAPGPAEAPAPAADAEAPAASPDAGVPAQE